MKTAEALLVYKEEIQLQNPLNWWKQQTQWLMPIHQYKGLITLQTQLFVFGGNDLQGNPHTLVFMPNQLTDVHLGFDTHYHALQDRSWGLQFQPLRLTVQNGNHTFVSYWVTDFNQFLRTTQNNLWAEALQHWKKGN